jgi:cytidylate kinase
MPVSVVRTREDEIAWERAKEAARRQYPDATGARFYRIVMAIFKKMTHRDANDRRRRPLFAGMY